MEIRNCRNHFSMPSAVRHEPFRPVKRSGFRFQVSRLRVNFHLPSAAPHFARTFQLPSARVNQFAQPSLRRTTKPEHCCSFYFSVPQNTTTLRLVVQKQRITFYCQIKNFFSFLMRVRLFFPSRATCLFYSIRKPEAEVKKWQ